MLKEQQMPVSDSRQNGRQNETQRLVMYKLTYLVYLLSMMTTSKFTHLSKFASQKQHKQWQIITAISSTTNTKTKMKSKNKTV
jgi:hypothetical protein